MKTCEKSGTHYWLSYGGGVNSTAFAILMVQGRFPQYTPWRIVFADTGDEKPETYAYISDVFAPWLLAHGMMLETVKPKETVLQRWQRLKVTGSRMIRACTEEGKIRPIDAHVKANGGALGRLIGIDAGESHRAKDRPNIFYPLVEADIDRQDCEKIILEEGLSVPSKSGCWHCPFVRVGEVIALAKTNPCRLAIIEKLEQVATETHGPTPSGGPRTQWGDKPVSYWRDRAKQGDLFIADKEPPEMCGTCYDG